MDFVNRETIITNMTEEFKPLMERYNIDDIGVYEEEGPHNQYYIGYTVKKDGHVFMINMPYKKNNEDMLAIDKQEWTIQSEGNEFKGFHSLDDVFEKVSAELDHT